MKNLLLIFVLVAFQAHATKGLIETNVLDTPNGQPVNEVPDPKVSSVTNGVVDLLRNRTNQPMSLQSINATQEVFDTSGQFDNTLRVNYANNKTVKVRVREFMGTLIILPEGDAIKMYKLGDMDNFSFEPSSNPFDNDLPNSGTVSVLLAGGDTSLHIMGTSGNYYTFYLRGDTFDSEHAPTMKVILTDDKLVAKLDAKKRREEIVKAKEEKTNSLAVNDKELKNPDYLEKVDFDPSKIDFGYRIKGGDENIRPFMVYSDGSFTYFRFSQESSVANVNSFPAVYRVADKSDVPVNSTAQGSTLRAEGVANNWTLRLGDQWLCIEKMIKTPVQVSSMNSIVKTDDKEFKPTVEGNGGR